MNKADKPQAAAHASFGKLPLQHYLTLRMSRVQAKLNAQASQLLRETVGLTLTQWRIVALIGVAGQTHLSNITKQTAMDKGLLSRNLKTLVANGLVLTQQDEADQRVQHLTLSPDGQAIFDRAVPITQRRQAWLRQDLTEEEIQTFRQVLDKLEIATEKRDFWP